MGKARVHWIVERSVQRRPRCVHRKDPGASNRNRPGPTLQGISPGRCKKLTTITLRYSPRNLQRLVNIQPGLVRGIHTDLGNANGCSKHTKQTEPSQNSQTDSATSSTLGLECLAKNRR